MLRTRRFITRTAAVAGLVVGLSSAPLVTAAQSPDSSETTAREGRRGGDGHYRRGHHRRARRALRALRELDLSDNQRAQVRAILETSRERAEELRSAGPGPETREQLHALRQETRALIHEVLTPAQRTELAQKRAEHLNRRLERMTERLSLSPAQAQEIRGILEAGHQAGQPRRQLRRQIEQILTPEQREQLPPRRARRGPR